MAVNTVASTHNEKGDLFRWAVGIESSCIPHLSVDQYAWTQHDRFWREDFAKVSGDLGCQWLRYSIHWHLVETAPGSFDWSWSDERIALAEKLGINLILDLAHFGTPAWLPDAFGDVDFPAALERFSRAFGERYAGRVHSICPINEPLITALFSGDVGLWPPHGTSLATYTVVLSRLAQGLTRSIRALRDTMPGVEIVLCDALEYASADPTTERTASPELLRSMQENVALRNDRRHVVLDLITGRVDAEHRLYLWLIKNGLSVMDLNWFLRNPIEIDLLGLDYYTHSEMELYPCGEQFRQRVPAQLAGLKKTARDYWERYRVPLMITETSCCGPDSRRREWLDFTVNDIRTLRAEGIPVVGYTWWPLLDHLDWDGAMLHQIGKIHEVGIYRLERHQGELRRVPTALVGAYRDLVQGGDEAAGELKPEAPARRAKTDLSSKKKNTMRTPLDYPIIVHCHLRWEGVWQRPQQFISRLGKNHRILFVEGPTLFEGDGGPRYELLPAPDFPNITLMQTHFPRGRFQDGAWVDAERLRLLHEALSGPLAGQFDSPVQWFYDPMAVVSFAGQLGERAVVYDCMDELAQFRFAPPELIHRERDLLQRADVVFTGGRKLWESKTRFNANCHFYGCGVELQHFGKARSNETAVPTDLDFVPRPILGFFGVVDERMDYELIAKLSDANPEWSIVMIGPVVKVDPNSLPVRPNIFWLGRRTYAQLPAYTKAFNVCLMPFALNEATEFINPTKALEYMATGKPIVSSAVPDVVSNFGKVVKIARSHDEFIELCRNAVDGPEEGAIKQGLQMAEENSWESIVASLEGHIKEALARKSSRAEEISLSTV